MEYLVTGGTGFIGSRLVLHLLKEGRSVRILAQENNETEAKNRRLLERKGAEVVISSITDREKVLEAAEGVDLVFHFAAAQHEVNIPDEDFYSVNVNGTGNVLEACEIHGVQRFVHGSTIGVYGSALDGLIDEQTPTSPDNIYGVTKLAAEEMIRGSNSQLPVIIIRISETYGPGDRRLLKLFRAIKKNSFFIIGDGANLHHPIYIDDLIQGFMLAATHDRSPGEIFVLSGKDVVTTNQMADTIALELSARVLPLRVPLGLALPLAAAVEDLSKPLGMQPPLHRRRLDFFRKSFAFANEKASLILNFEPEVGFEDGVARTAAWYSEEGLL